MTNFCFDADVYDAIGTDSFGRTIHRCRMFGIITILCTKTLEENHKCTYVSLQPVYFEMNGEWYSSHKELPKSFTLKPDHPFNNSAVYEITVDCNESTVFTRDIQEIL